MAKGKITVSKDGKKQTEKIDLSGDVKEVLKIREGVVRANGQIENRIDHYLNQKGTQEHLHEYWKYNVSTGAIETGLSGTNAEGKKV